MSTSEEAMHSSQASIDTGAPTQTMIAVRLASAIPETKYCGQPGSVVTVPTALSLAVCKPVNRDVEYGFACSNSRSARC